MMFEEIIGDICGEDWKTVSEREKDGGYGIAIIIAYLQGCKPDLNDLSKFLDTYRSVLEVPYKRLQINGLFSNKSWILHDELLMGNHDGSVKSEISCRRLWCHVAAMAGGFIGKGKWIEGYRK